MVRAPVTVEFSQNADFAHDLEADLLKELREKSPQAVNSSFAFQLRDVEGEVLGGVTASTSYGWLLIKTLCVAPPARRNGHGRALLDAAMKHALTLGCHSAWLDTSNKEACSFYLALGFEEFGKLSNEQSKVPQGHSRWFLKLEIPQ